jgi:hypothetical protein
VLLAMTQMILGDMVDTVISLKYKSNIIMSKTQNQLQGYIETNFYNHYQQWKTSQGFDDDSIALNYLLADFFGLEYSPDKVEINERLDLIESQLSNLNIQIESLKEVVNKVNSLDSLTLPNSDNSNVLPKKQPRKKQESKSIKKPIQKKQNNEEKIKQENEENNYEEMTKKELFILLTKRNISHRIAPKDRLKRKEEIILDLLAWDKQEI